MWTIYSCRHATFCGAISAHLLYTHSDYVGKGTCCILAWFQASHPNWHPGDDITWSRSQKGCKVQNKPASQCVGIAAFDRDTFVDRGHS